MTKVNINQLIVGVKLGKVVSFPTDTVPALAAIPSQCQQIFTLKNRSLNKPLILMAASPQDIWPYVGGKPWELAIWEKVATIYWPGQLTLVLPASENIPSTMNPTSPTSIGVRVPDCNITQQILSQTGPLATTSANLTGEVPLESMTAIDKTFPQILVLDWPDSAVAGSSIPSTVAKWMGEDWEILRQGKIEEIKV